MSALSSWIKCATCVPFAVGLAACAGLPQPFSQLDGHRYNLTPIDTYSMRFDWQHFH